MRALQQRIAEGLGPAHHLSGTCSFVIEDERTQSFTLRLEPGRCSFGALEPRADTTITLNHACARDLAGTCGSFDVRERTFQRSVRHTGDAQLFVEVIQSLQRPAPGTAARLSELEALSEASEAIARLVQLERVEAPSEAEVQRRIDQGVPFVVTGALRGWALSPNIEALVAKHPAARVRALLADHDEPLADFVARATRPGSGAVYTLGTPLPRELEASFPPPYFEGHLRPAQLWMGSGVDERTPVTPLHRDLECGLLGQVSGRKRLTLYPPHHARYLYPRAAFFSYQLCWASPSAPDLQRYPGLAQARGVDVVLEPGELLVQPCGWFHCVYSLSAFTMSVSSFVEREG